MHSELHHPPTGDSKDVSEATSDSSPIYVAESLDDIAKPISSSSHHHRRTSIVSFSTSANPFTIFRNVLPDRSSRLMFLVAVLGIIVGTALWLHWTITVKWIQQQQHPNVMVTLERLDEVPPMNAVGFNFNQIFFDIPYAYAQANGIPFNDTTDKTPKNSMGPFIAPYFQRSSGGCVGCNITDPVSVVCDMIDIRNKSFLCQPAKDGKPLYSSDMSAPLPDLDSEWDWNLRSTGDELCFYIWEAVDILPVLELFNVKTFPYYLPYLEVYLTPSSSVSPFNYWMSAGRDPSMLTTMKSSLPASFVYPMNNYHATSLSVSKYKGLNDQFAQRTYTIANRDSLGMTDEMVANSLQFFAYLFPNDYERVNTFLKNDTTNHKLFFMTYCLRMSDMSAIVSTEITTYGVLPFLSDCGGFLSLLLLGLSLLFPIVARVSEPRQFLPLLLVGKFQHRKDDIQHRKASVGMNGSTAGDGSEYIKAAASRRPTHQSQQQPAASTSLASVDDHQVAQPQVQVELTDVTPSLSQPINQQAMSDANVFDQSQL